MKHLSTFEEVTQRGKIYEIVESELQPDTFIVIFENGTQANVDYSTMAKLCLADVWSVNAPIKNLTL